MNEKVNATVNEEQVNQATEQATETNENVNQQPQPAAKEGIFDKVKKHGKTIAKVAIGGTLAIGGTYAAVKFGGQALEGMITKAVEKGLTDHTITIGLEDLKQLNEMTAPAAEAVADVVADTVESTI